MKRDGNPTRLLNRLIDAHERQSDRTRRIIARPAQAFADSGARDGLIAGLTAARDAGAVLLEWDRDAPHLVARVILADADILYRHLGRTPSPALTASAIAGLATISPNSEIGIEILEAVRHRWQAGAAYLGFGPDKLDDALALVRAADAAFADLGEAPLPLRTRSARLLGDSKALERQLSRLIGHLKRSGRLENSLDREAALDALGLAKFPQPVLVAGPIKIANMAADRLPYLGIPPESLESISLTRPVRSVLTIENLESFHRHVREAREPDGVVVYCAGFPPLGVVRIVRHLMQAANLTILRHWGDIDPGGIRIGRYLEEAVGLRVRPHLMSEALARAHGKRQASTAIAMSTDSAFAGLAQFLASQDAHWLEQEVLEPACVQPLE